MSVLSKIGDVVDREIIQSLESFVWEYLFASVMPRFNITCPLNYHQVLREFLIVNIINMAPCEKWLPRKRKRRN
jgi:hypothetical protein